MDGTGYVEKRSLGDKVKGALGVGGHRHTAGNGYGTGYKLILPLVPKDTQVDLVFFL